MKLEELQSQIMVAPFVDLEAHVLRGAVFMVEEGLDLATVALEMVQDNREAIASLLQKLELVKVGPADLKKWREEKVFFNILIVQPFVLAQVFRALNPLPAH